MRASINFLIVLTWLALPLSGYAATTRPMIWVTAKDRAPILEKIRTEAWAQASMESMKERVHEAVLQHQQDPDEFLRGLPWVDDSENPNLHPTLYRIDRNMASLPPKVRTNSLQRYLVTGVDCGVLYFLTREEAYARCAADILHAVVEAMVQMEPNGSTVNGGLIYPDDHLYDARVVGAQVPLIYDLVAEYLKAGASVYDLAEKGQSAFNFENAQHVFRVYAWMAIEHGIVDCNWPVLEMSSLAHNILALDDPAERNRLLAFVTHQDTEHQDSLKKVIAQFDRPGAVWPEPFGYSGAVAELSTYMVALLLRQNPPVELPDDFIRVPLSLSRLQEFKFPNGENIRFGDGPRRSGEDYEAYEIAYAIGLRENNEELQRIFGARINLGLEQGKYRRSSSDTYHLSAHPYLAPLQLLWFAPEVAGQMLASSLPVTDELPFVGAVLQRNISPTRDPEHGLMSVVLGGHFVHAHAFGMSLELYGVGEALGTAAGKGVYRTDEHENYRRMFAAYNCVIVNGASRTAGGWVNLGINTVKTIALEPAVGENPVSQNNSFTLSSFADQRGPGAKAQQERLVGIVRTSPETGYYVDVFRSKSELPEQFHDYLYHNIGDGVSITSGSSKLPLLDTPDRFIPAQGTQWISNETYLYPGWHFFKDARTSALFESDVIVEFSAAELDQGSAHMRLFIPGTAGREYSTAYAPETKDAPGPYAKAPTPVLVIRQKGEAWEQPFAVVYEPYKESGSIQSVTTLQNPSSGFSGFKVISEVKGRKMTQYVLVQPSAHSVFRDENLGISFRGRYGIISVDEDNTCTRLYIGEGSQLRFKSLELSSVSGANTSASADLTGSTPTLVAIATAELVLPDGRRILSGKSSR